MASGAITTRSFRSEKVEICTYLSCFVRSARYRPSFGARPVWPGADELGANPLRRGAARVAQWQTTSDDGRPNRRLGRRASSYLFFGVARRGSLRPQGRSTSSYARRRAFGPPSLDLPLHAFNPFRGRYLRPSPRSGKLVRSPRRRFARSSFRRFRSDLFSFRPAGGPPRTGMAPGPGRSQKRSDLKIPA